MTEGFGAPLNFVPEARASLSPPWAQPCRWMRFAWWERVGLWLEREPWLMLELLRKF